VVYHVNEGNAQALNALRNIRNHLTADPSAKIVVVTHAGGINFLLDGAQDANGAPFEATVQELKSKGVDFRVCQFTLQRNNIDPKKVIPEPRSFRPVSPRWRWLQFKERLRLPAPLTAPESKVSHGPARSSAATRFGG